MNYSKVKAVWWSGTCYHKEQLDAILKHPDIKHRAHILHDKCPREDNKDELKKPHYHFLVQFTQQVRGSWFKMFASDDMGIVFVEACFAPQGAFDYLIHNTPAAIRAEKYQYDIAERITDIDGFEGVVKDEDEHPVLLDDIWTLIRKEITWEQFIQRKPKRIHMISNIKTTHDLLSRQPRFTNTFRELDVTYIFGQTDKGKTRHVMEKYGYENVFRVTKYDRTAFDEYKGQDVVVFEEFRSSFKIEEMLNYLDGYPLQLPSRYNDKEAAYTKVYIVTNWKLSEQYRNVQSEHPTTWAAFNRRIHKIFDFDKNKEFNLKMSTNDPEQGMLQLTTEELAEMPF